MSEQNLIDPKKFAEQIPEDCSIKHKHLSKEGFATALWKLLNWAEVSDFRKLNLGMRWCSDEEFLIDKKRFCSVTNTPINTLNCKLKAYQFVQSSPRHNSITFYKCDLFSRSSTPEDLQHIDNRKNPNNDVSSMPRAMFLPLLVSVRYHSQKPSDTSYLKFDSINLWEDIIHRPSVWSCSRSYFIKSAAELFCQPFDEYRRLNVDINPDADPLSGFNAQQTDFLQYISANGLDIITTARQMINYVIPPSEVITLRDFCMFYARFGPDDYLIEKIHQLLCCSKSYGDWFIPDEQIFTEEKSISGSYSNTFANCFIIKGEQKITYHIYNMYNTTTKSGFLIDETGKKFNTWHAVCQCFPMQQQPISYGGNYDSNILYP